MLRDYKGTVEILLENGADVNAKDNEGKTALMEAGKFGYKDTVEILLQNDIDINAKDNHGKSALIYAVKPITVRVGVHIYCTLCYQQSLANDDLSKPLKNQNFLKILALFQRFFAPGCFKITWLNPKLSKWNSARLFPSVDSFWQTGVIIIAK